jgi:hypothetical protein
VLPCCTVALVLPFPMVSKAEPLSAMRHSPHPLISSWGQAPLVPRSLLQQCEGIGSKEDGALLSSGVLSHADDRSPIDLGISNVPFPSDYQIFRTAPSGTPGT